MAQEDKALVMRGMFLLTLIGVLTTFVLVIIFWRTQTPTQVSEPPPERWIASALAPSLADPPGHVWWPALFQAAEKLPSSPGWEIRYNAVASQARRGDPEVRWSVFREMLDEKQQLNNQRARRPDGTGINDEVVPRAFLIVAMKALATWHEKQPESNRTPSAELLDIYGRVDELARSPHENVKAQAEKTRATFFK